MELVSIVIPVYNCETKLKRCLQSVQKQTYKDIEVLIVNDGSTDNSLQVCEEFCKQDVRFHVFNQKNHGVSYSRNQGIKKANGQYLMFVDGDDEVLPDMVQQYIVSAKNGRADVVIGGLQMMKQNGDIVYKVPTVYGNIDKSKLWEMICEDNTGTFGYVPNKLYRLQLIVEENILFREDMSAQEDLEFALSAFSKCKKVRCIDYCGYRYYYDIGKREMPLVDLVSNQRKILQQAKNAGVSSQKCKNIKRKIQDAAYVSIFRAENYKKIKQISQLFKKEDFGDINNLPKEMKMSLFLFSHQRYFILYVYFRMRNSVKRILGKETI